MAASIHQKTALDAMQDAVDALCSQYRVNRGINVRRDQIKEFLSIVLHSTQQLIAEEHDLCDGNYPTVQAVIDEIDEAFQPAIDAEDEREALAHPAFSQRCHGTHNHRQQGLSR